MGDMITNTLQNALLSVWQGVVYYLTLQFLDLDPFWGYLFFGVIVCLAAAAISHFFSPWIPALRPIAGVIIVAVSFGLYAYRKGSNDARARIVRRKTAARPTRSQQ